MSFKAVGHVAFGLEVQDDEGVPAEQGTAVRVGGRTITVPPGAIVIVGHDPDDTPPRPGRLYAIALYEERIVLRVPSQPRIRDPLEYLPINPLHPVCDAEDVERVIGPVVQIHFCL